MGNLQIKNLPEPVHRELRKRAAQAGMTIRDYVLDLIRRDQELPSRSDWAAEVRALKPAEMDESSSELIARQRAERMRGAGC